MKILQINVRYNYGSTGKITADIHNGVLKSGWESVVLFGRKDQSTDPCIRRVCSEFYAKANNLRSRIDGYMYGGCFFSTNKIIAEIKKENPDVVHLHCINGYFVNIYRLVEWLKRKNIKTVLTLHAEFMYTANCSHSMECDKWQHGCGNCPNHKKATKSMFWDRTAQSFEKMRKAFEGFNDNLTVVSVSPWLADRAVKSEILKDKKHKIIYNGVDTSVFDGVCNKELLQEYKTAGTKIVFHATAMFTDKEGHLKGGRYVIELAERMKDKDVIFLVAGKTEVSCELPSNIVLLGDITDKKLLAEYYAAADLTLLTSKRETFSMICAESLCCGTPVAGFECGAAEQISLNEYSGFVEYGNTGALQTTVENWLDRSVDRMDVIRKAQTAYSKEKMVYEYINTYQEMIYEN